MPRLTVAPLTVAHLDDAARLFAARHAADRARLPFLAAALETPRGASELLGPLLASAKNSAASAWRGSELIGFLIGELSFVGPEQFMAGFLPPVSMSIPLTGHAVALTEDPVEVYRDLYGYLAAEWVRSGFFVHRPGIVAGDAGVQEAWVALGFGRNVTAAVRTTAEPVEGRIPAEILVHEASAEDIDVVMRLADELNQHHATSPMFWPLIRTADAAAREMNLQHLREAKTPYFIAYDQGVPVGMQTFLQPGFSPATIEAASNVYLFEGIVSPVARSGGVGTALLNHSMDWARRAGYTTCTLHFASGNSSGAPFWLVHGFVPVEYGMERRVDERIAWANR